jgi:alginate O-acetyltransferase complex protein AlgI
MLFNSFVFIFLFLPVTYLVFWSLRSAQSRYVWLTLTGYVFYGYWDARFCLLMAFSTIVSYSAGLGFLRWADPRLRKLCLWTPVVIDLSLLGFFKYGTFAVDSTGQVLRWLGSDVRAPHWDIVLPVGISFYTFHTITYIVDSYRGVVRPTRNLFEFSCYVSLFSQLVAGPIVRFRQIEEDLVAIGRGRPERWLAQGVSFFIVGLVEKVALADSLAVFVNPALARYQDLSTAGAWAAMLAYTLQLYFDFSGYSTMAVGLGYLFGLRIPQNFNSPYKALNPSDFWARWHISLSTCLRDYLYIPLGGNRQGEFRTYRNLMLTMLIGGLWHGAAWTFVAWGAYHGALLALYRRFRVAWDALPAGVRQLGTFLLVLIGWVLFRSKDFHMAGALLVKMFAPVAGRGIPHPEAALIFISLGVAWAMLAPNPFQMQHRATWPRAVALAAALGACLAIISGSRASPFLYFQF